MVSWEISREFMVGAAIALFLTLGSVGFADQNRSEEEMRIHGVVHAIEPGKIELRVEGEDQVIVMDTSLLMMEGPGSRLPRIGERISIDYTMKANRIILHGREGERAGSLEDDSPEFPGTIDDRAFYSA